jgi:hypothetical protein
VALVSQVQIGFLAGNPQLTSVSFLVASFTDAAITVSAYSDAARTVLVTSRTVNASAGAAPKLAKYCDDRGSNDPAGVTYVCWIGSSSLTGLIAGTRYYLKLTQGAVTETDATTCTAPAAGSDCSVWVCGCDISHSVLADPTHQFGDGIYPTIKAQVEANLARPAFLMFADDIGYADGIGTPVFGTSCLVDDATTGKQATGTSYTTGLQYDYGVIYIGLLGMLGDTGSTGSVLHHTSEWGRKAGRNFCIRNMPWAVQWGDHEIVDGAGQRGTAATAESVWASGSAAFNNFFGLIRPTPAINTLATSGVHWALVLGDLKIIAPDALTYSTGGTYASYPYSYGAIYGTNQIDDVLTAANTSEPFKLMLCGYTGEWPWQDAADFSSLTNAPDGVEYQYCQAPLALMQPTEWARLHHNAGQTPLSLMDNPKTNGETGVLIYAHGDSHIPHVERQYGYATGATGSGLRANWISYYFATANRSQRPTSEESWALVQGRWHEGKESLFAPPTTSHYTPVVRTDFFGGLELVVEGSAPVKQVTASLWTKTGLDETIPGEVAYSGLFRVGSNRPIGQMFSDWEVHPMTYSEFRTLLAGYLHRTDITSASLVNFIEFGRIRLFDDLRVAEMETTATVTITSDEGSLSADLVEIRSVQDGDGLELERVGLLELIPGVNTYQYSVRGHTIIAPGQSSLAIAYYARPTTLVGAADSATRTLLDAYPSLWLQAALVEGYRFTQDYAAEANVSQSLAREIEKANSANTGGRMGVKPTQKDPRRLVTAGGSGL